MFARFAYVEDRPEDADGDASAASEEPEVARHEIITQESSPDNDAPAAATSSFFASSQHHRHTAIASRPERASRRYADRRAAGEAAQAAPAHGRGRRQPRNDRPRGAAGGADQYVAGHGRRPFITGKSTVHHRLRSVLSSPNADWYRLQSKSVARDAARADGADDLDPAWLSAKENVADVISWSAFATTRRNSWSRWLQMSNASRPRRGSTEGLGYKGDRSLAGLES